MLVTGASGFIGQHLVRRLMQDTSFTQIIAVSRSYENRIANIRSGRFILDEIKCDVTDKEQVGRLLDKAQPDVIYHLAGNPSIKEYGPDSTETNLLSTHYLLSACKMGTVFVLASSAAVYGDMGIIEVCSETTECKPNSVYGVSKLASEGVVKAYEAMGKIRGLCLRLVANVGRGATHGFIKDLVWKLQSDSPTLQLLGDSPGSKKPFVHVTDTANAFAQAVLHGWYTKGLIFNVGYASEMTVLDVACTAKELLGINKPIEWSGANGTWFGDNPIVRVTGWRALKQGWKPHYPSSKDAVVQAIKELGGLPR